MNMTTLKTAAKMTPAQSALPIGSSVKLTQAQVDYRDALDAQWIAGLVDMARNGEYAEDRANAAALLTNRGIAF